MTSDAEAPKAELCHDALIMSRAIARLEYGAWSVLEGGVLL
jgi:hypothetical protein